MSDDELDAEALFMKYKAHERAAGREPLGWGEWLRRGMPTPIEEETEVSS